MNDADTLCWRYFMLPVDRFLASGGYGVMVATGSGPVSGTCQGRAVWT